MVYRKKTNKFFPNKAPNKSNPFSFVVENQRSRGENPFLPVTEIIEELPTVHNVVVYDAVSAEKIRMKGKKDCVFSPKQRMDLKLPRKI